MLGRKKERSRRKFNFDFEIIHIFPSRKFSECKMNFSVLTFSSWNSYIFFLCFSISFQVTFRFSNRYSNEFSCSLSACFQTETRITECLVHIFQFFLISTCKVFFRIFIFIALQESFKYSSSNNKKFRNIFFSCVVFRVFSPKKFMSNCEYFSFYKDLNEII